MYMVLLLVSYMASEKVGSVTFQLLKSTSDVGNKKL